MPTITANYFEKAQDSMHTGLGRPVTKWEQEAVELHESTSPEAIVARHIKIVAKRVSGRTPPHDPVKISKSCCLPIWNVVRALEALGVEFKPYVKVKKPKLPKGEAGDPVFKGRLSKMGFSSKTDDQKHRSRNLIEAALESGAMSVEQLIDAVKLAKFTICHTLKNNPRMFLPDGYEMRVSKVGTEYRVQKWNLKKKVVARADYTGGGKVSRKTRFASRDS